MNLTIKPIRILLTFLLFVLLLSTINPSIYADTAQVKSSTVNVRSGPGLEHEVIRQIQAGNSFTILSIKDSWIEIDLANDQRGWVADWLVDVKVEQQNTTSEQLLEATVEILNVRSGPSTSFKIVDKIAPGTSYPLLESDGEWSKITLSDTRVGWVSSQYTRLIDKITVQNEIEPIHTEPNTNSSNNNTSEDQTEEVNVTTTVIVNTEILNLRKSPSLDAEIVKKLSLGTEAKKLQSNDEWSEVQLEDGTKGWVFRTYVKEVKGVYEVKNPEAPVVASPASVPVDAKVKIITNGTNLRNGPSTSKEIVQTAKAGETFPIIQVEGDWFQIDIGSGKTAYVAGWVVAAEGVPNIERSSLANALAGKVIVVDAGHGGGDRGAEGIGKKTKEKEVNLLVASLLAKKLEAAGAKVIMTRSTDIFLSLQQRVDISTKYKADAFISIHHNSYKHSTMNGSMSFYFSAAKDKNLASYIQSDLVKYNGLTNLGARKGDYHVLRENPQPAVLVEIGFLSNLNEELLIRSSKFQENSAEGIFQGTMKYFASLKK